MQHDPMTAQLLFQQRFCLRVRACACTCVFVHTRACVRVRARAWEQTRVWQSHVADQVFALNRRRRVALPRGRRLAAAVIPFRWFSQLREGERVRPMLILAVTSPCSNAYAYILLLI